MILRGSLFSQVLGMETPLAVITPQDATLAGPHPVIYALHGTCGAQDDLLHYTRLALYAQQYQCVIVMPNGVRSFFADMVYGQKYFTYLTEELPQHCRSAFQISEKPEDTYIIGNSSGGYAALRCALTYPQRYAACCANAPGSLFLKDFFRELDEKGRTPEMIAVWSEQFITDFRAAFGEHFDWSPEIELLELAKRVPGGSGPRFLVQVGTEDYLLDLNRQFQAEMERLPLEFHYQELSGLTHDFTFFDQAVERALQFCLAGRQEATQP